jgi:hypothetical protein
LIKVAEFSDHMPSTVKSDRLRLFVVEWQDEQEFTLGCVGVGAQNVSTFLAIPLVAKAD